MFLEFLSRQEMSLADFLRGNLLPTADNADAEGEGTGVGSFPITWKTTSVTIPKDEHTIFAAVRYNDTQRIDQLLRQGFDVNTLHTCEDKFISF